MWQAAEDFNLDLLAAQLSPVGRGPLGPSHSFLEVGPDTIQVSAVKRSERGGGWIVRLFNSGSETVEATVRLNGGKAAPQATASPVERIRQSYLLPDRQPTAWGAVRAVSLEELPEEDLPIRDDGSVAIALGSRQIRTLEWRV